MCDLLVVTDESYGYSTQGIIPMYKCKHKFLIRGVVTFKWKNIGKFHNKESFGAIEG